MQPDDAGSLTNEPPVKPLPEQRPLDFLRGEQLRLLRDCELPRNAKDRQGKGVRATVLKMVLIAIDHFGRGRAGGAFASVQTLANKANIGLRTCTRALEVLTALGLVCVENDERRWGRLGSPTNRYTIVWSELALRCDRGLLSPPARGAVHSALPHADHRATASDQSATGTDQSATGTDQSATGTDQSATGGALNVSKRQTRSAYEAPSDVGGDVDGARFFSWDEVAAIRAKANTLHGAARAITADDRQLVLKIATLWVDGDLADDMVEQVLESFERKRAGGAKIDRPLGWLWACLRNQCRKHGLRFEKMLAGASYPEELLAPASSATPQR